MRYLVRTVFLAFVALFAIGCNANTALKSTNPSSSGKTSATLKSANGKSFPISYHGVGSPALTVIYVGGMGGKGKEVSSLARSFNSVGLNLLTFDRAEPSCSGGRSCFLNVLKRSQTGTAMFKGQNGELSSTEDILNNEIAEVLAYAQRAPSYDPAKGIVLIGGSYGAWLSLKAVERFNSVPIKGIVFLSPAILSYWVHAPTALPHQFSNYQNAINAFGQRPALAIGSRTDFVAKRIPQVATKTTLDSANLLGKDIGSNVKVVEVGSSAHSSVLIRRVPSTANLVVSWIASNFGK